MSTDIPPSPFSSPFLDFASWTAADLVVWAGAVAIDLNGKKVLLLRGADGALSLPSCADPSDNTGKFVESPFEPIEKETGHIFEKLPCRRPRRFARLRQDHPDKFCSVVNLGREATVDPCYISFDVLWTKVSEKWYDSHQRMTLWFVCTARSTSDAASRANSQVMWMPLADAQAQLDTQGRRSLSDCAVLKQIAYMWTSNASAASSLTPC